MPCTLPQLRSEHGIAENQEFFLPLLPGEKVRPIKQSCGSARDGMRMDSARIPVQCDLVRVRRCDRLRGIRIHRKTMPHAEGAEGAENCEKNEGPDVLPASIPNP